MPGTLKNLRTLFSDTRRRNIFMSIVGVLVIATMLSVYLFYKRLSSDEAKVNLSRVPGNIRSVPGGLNPTREYARLQEQENVQKAQSALYTGKSVIPTLIRSQQFGEGTMIVEQYKQEGGLYFSTLVQRERQSGIPKTYSCPELKNSGFDARQFRELGYSAEELRDCGFTAAQLRAAGFSADELRAAGFTDDELRAAGFSIDAVPTTQSSRAHNNKPASSTSCSSERIRKLRELGVRAHDIQLTLGCSDEELLAGGFSLDELHPNEIQSTDAALTTSNDMDSVNEPFALADNSMEALNDFPDIDNIGTSQLPSVTNAETANLERLLAQQREQFDDQRYQQQIQQRQAAMSSRANQLLASWRPTPVQYYVEGVQSLSQASGVASNSGNLPGSGNVIVKAGDVMFAVLDTAINSDEPGPILATIISGELEGAKLIGSLSLPRNAQKLILSFNTLSLPEASRTMSINAVAIDPDTARTALSDRTDNHYLMRYGSLFGSAFLEGFGRAYTSQGTRVEVTGFGSIIEDAPRSVPQNLAIGFGEVGRRVGNQVGNVFNRPPTVEVFSGTGIGILFTSDVAYG